MPVGRVVKALRGGGSAPMWSLEIDGARQNVFGWDELVEMAHELKALGEGESLAYARTVAADNAATDTFAVTLLNLLDDLDDRSQREIIALAVSVAPTLAHSPAIKSRAA